MCAAVLRLEDATMQQVNDLYFVEDQSSVRLECFGSGNLQWNSSTGLEIPVATSGNIYQSYDSTRDALFGDLEFHEHHYIHLHLYHRFD